MNKPKILLIDDNEAFLDLFLSLAETEDVEIIPLSSPKKAIEFIDKNPVDLIVSDIQMDEMTGTELFKKVQDLCPDIPFILITAYGSVEKAIESVKQGAFHYFVKPLNDKLDLFWTTVREALAKREMLKEITSLRKKKLFRKKTSLPIIGRSKEIRRVLQSINEIAELSVNVLIYGETGTGKELVARAIHDQGARCRKDFLAVNCAEFNPGLLENELFGHEKGAFTGAVGQKKGIFEIADNGTLFLDEISEFPYALQPKLLRVIETRNFKRVGGNKTVSSDFRLIAATNRNLEEEVTNGRFREDLFFRLNVYSIKIPPLRNRREDIPLFAEYYCKKFSHKYRRPIEGISENVLLSLMRYDWPGNVRELVNVMERAVIICKDSLITTRHLPWETISHDRISTLNLKEMEKFYIGIALKRTRNNKSHAAKLLGISRKTLIEKVKKYQLEQTSEA